MKKLIIALLAVLVCAGILVGCSPAKSRLESVLDNVSYVQETLSVGADAKMTSELSSGRREITYVADGVAEDMMDYCTLTIRPIDTEYYARDYSYKLVGDKGEIEGVLQRAIIGISQVADIVDIDKIGVVSKVVITVDTEVIEQTLTNVMEGKVTGFEAVENVYNDSVDVLEVMFDGNTFMSEVHVKLTRSKEMEGDKYYWYVAIIENSESCLYALVDADTGEVLIKKAKS